MYNYEGLFNNAHNYVLFLIINFLYKGERIMKKSILTLLVAVFSITTITSLAFSQEHKLEQSAQKMTFIGTGEMNYTCPMPGDSVFSSEPGKCPKYGMNLKAMTPGQKAGLLKMTAQHETPPKSGELISLAGEVVDTACFMRSGHKGASHKMCAEAGISLGILDEKTNNLYIVIPEMGINPNDKLLAYVADHVVVTGLYHEKGGIAGIEIQNVEKNQ